MQLRDYQIKLAGEVADKVSQYRLAYLCAEPRCGKTGAALEAARRLGKKNVLFITKLKAIGSIESDYRQFGFKEHFKLQVINYESVHLVFSDFDLIIIDESHRNGGFPKKSLSVDRIQLQFSGIDMILLSATPHPESYSQLYHQLAVSDHSPFKEYKSFYKWAADYVLVKDKMINGIKFKDYSRGIEGKIREATDHLFVTFTQAEAGFNQVIEEEVLLVRMEKGTYYIADKLIKDKLYRGRQGEVILADTPVKLQNKLHQIFSGTVLTEERQGIIFDKSKVSFIRQHFAGQKIAIFYKFIAEEIMIRSHIGAKTTQSPEEFEKSTDLVFTSQFISGREGVNIASADALIFINIDFAALSYIQARQRIQTKDRIKPAKLYWIFSEGGIEHKIYKTVINKMDYTNARFKKDFGITSPNKDQKGVGKTGLAGSQDHELQPARVA